jgi:hypothetical protein
MSNSTFDLPGHVVFRLRREDAGLLQGLCERCSAYFELHDGAPPGPTIGEEEVVALPEGKTLGDKFLFGIRSATGELVGVLDLIRDFPAPGEWWLGLLMLDPRERSAGLGAVPGACCWACWSRTPTPNGSGAAWASRSCGASRTRRPRDTRRR